MFFNDGHRELYNLKDDIGETENLADKLPKVADSLHGELKAWWKEVDARFPKGVSGE